MSKGMYKGVSNVAKKVKKIYKGEGNIARKVMRGYKGVSNVAREFFSGEYSNLLEAYQDGAITGLVTAWGYDKDNGDTWEQSSYVSVFAPTSENTFDKSATLASESSSKYTTNAIITSGLYIFCPTLENAKQVAETIQAKYTTVKGYDTNKKKYFDTSDLNTFDSSDVTYSTGTCASTGLTIGYWGRYGNATSSWNASTASGYSDKYYVLVAAGYFCGNWNDSGDYAKSLDQIIFS